MGTNTNQIATRANINSGKRKNAYYISSSTDAQKCPTKGEINQIEFLDVKNASTARTEDNAYDSYYDDDCKLAQYEDIGEDTARTFGVYYGVWNNKSTPARVDFAEALIHTTSDTYATGWTSIGKVTLSDIAGKGYRSGVITCTLPTNINLATTQYYLIIKVGDTLNKQDFYSGWGNEKENVSYTYCQKGIRGWTTTAIPLTPNTPGNSVSVLNFVNTIDGSTTIVKGSYNTNPEHKGWIKIE